MFVDQAGRGWVVKFSPETIAKVSAEFHLDLSALMNDHVALIDALGKPNDTLVYFLVSVLDSEIRRRDMSPYDFILLLDCNTTYRHALRVIVEALADAFPDSFVGKRIARLEAAGNIFMR